MARTRPALAPSGFTLVELLVSLLVGGLVVAAAGTALLSHLRSSERAEALERQRADWTRSTFFLEAEVALSQEVISGTALAALTIPATCAALSSANLRFALRLQPNIAPVLYAVKPSEPPWLPANSLWRCGPEIDATGAYAADTTPSLRLLVDGLDGAASGGGLSVSAAADDRRLTYTLGLLGLARNTYSQRSTSQGRVMPYYVRPPDSGVCWSSTNISDPDTGALKVVCNGVVPSGQADLVIEKHSNNPSGNTSATLTATGGNVRLRGTPGNDVLTSGAGDDALVGLAGNDNLSGGGGFNRYLPGLGNDAVTGGGGVDVVFFDGLRSAYTLSAGCSRASCSVISAAEGSDSLTNVDVLVFTDQVVRLD